MNAGPASSTPPRRPGSVRRTTTHDSVRPDGLRGPITVVAQGRDLLTGAEDTTAVLGTARLDVQVTAADRAIVRIDCDPPDPRLQALVGVRASVGFRQAVIDAMPDEKSSHRVRFQLLDDLPTALLVSGYATLAAGVISPGRGRPMLQHPDLCAGWVTGGTLLRSRSADGVPRRHTGPEAPPVDAGDDPLAWHHFDPLPHHGMRRRRRIDVWEHDDLAEVECFFRDSHLDADGVETIVHEYTVRATVDPSTQQFLSCEADVGALPYPECPAAADSAGRLRGAPVDGLRRWVRDTFVGPTTCTHLNDTLRALEDVGGLLALLQGSASANR
jgi:hypothetical protein